jgi:surface antigen
MNHEEYKKNWLGKRIDTDKMHWYQCVDLAKHYMSLVHWYTSKSFSWTAIKGFETWSPFDATRTKVPFWKNTPKQGDVIFWKASKANQNCGHVAIVDSVVTDWVRVIEQNGVWGTQWLNADAIRIQTYPRAWIVGRYVRKIIIDEKSPKTIAIRQAMKECGELRHTLEKTKDHVSQDTIDMINETQKSISAHNNYYRQFWY